jgi:D-cysteine desulfhydrase
MDLARLNTPLVALGRLSRKVGIEILCKRDDLTGCLVSGNKIRKLEFLLAEAADQGHDRVITCGGEQSNHARAAAVAAARVGLGCHLLLRTQDPEAPPPLEGNLLLDRMVGAAIKWITPEQYADRDELMADEAKRLESAENAKVYVIPEGGSNALGAWGYVRCAEELAQQLGQVEATVVYAVGSGGTAAGLIAGCRLLDLPYRLVGVCVCDDRPTFQQRISGILDEMADAYKLDVRTPPDEIEIWDDYVGLGYALSRQEELVQMQYVARLEGLITDPVYSGKALFGLLSEVDRGTKLAEPVVFLHTGGIFGLFPKADQIAPLVGHEG